MSILGLHHVTAMSGDPQRNAEFYAGLLGLRLVKVTVNYDDPGTYHLYYGDAVGSPGSAMTFFPWPSAYRGRRGTGQVGVTAFSVPVGALDFWADRLQARGVEAAQTSRFGESGLAFSDPDGLALEIVGTVDDPRTPWVTDEVEEAVAVRGFHSVALLSADPGASGRFLVETMGFVEAGHEGDRVRFRLDPAVPGGTVEIVEAAGLGPGRMGVGTVHHVAWRLRDDASQAEWLQRLRDAGHGVTPVQDRTYFRSVYFREPGTVLYELATDGPGFAVDEPLESLGGALVLPAHLEQARGQIGGRLPAFTTPAGVRFP